MPGVHDRFDLDLWMGRFSLEVLRREAEEFFEQRRREAPEVFGNEATKRSMTRLGPRGNVVDGPKYMAVIEQLRTRSARPLPPDLVPADVFVWARGEGGPPAGTKIAGLPYRPASAPWPTSREGKPMDFLAQICFADSRDIAGALPGDVLLIFCDGEGLSACVDEPEGVAFEWWPLGLGDLAGRDGVPERRWTLNPVHAQIHRTADYADPPDPEDSPLLTSMNDVDSILVVNGTKIGGVPIWPQGDPELPGRHLCSLASLNPYGERWPLLNVERNPLGRAYLDKDLLMLGDLGNLNISIDSAGGLHWRADCG